MFRAGTAMPNPWTSIGRPWNWHWSPAARLVCLLAVVAAESARAGDLLVSSRFSNNVLRYNAQTGAFVGVFASGSGLANPNGIAFGPNGNLFVGLGDLPRILEFDGTSGAFVGEFVGPSTPGGLTNCRAIAFGPDGNLYVNSAANHRVLKYDGNTGGFLGIAAIGEGINGPVGLTFGPDGNLYLGAALSNQVYVFSPSGTFLRSFSCGAGFSNAVGLLFDPSGRLLVAQSQTNNILAFDASNGTCLGVAASGGGLTIPIHMILQTTGKLLVGSFGNDSVIEYDLSTGLPTRTLISSGLGGLNGTHNFAFLPDPPVPTTSSWGALTLFLGLLTFGTTQLSTQATRGDPAAGHGRQAL